MLDLEDAVKEADLVIGAVLVPGAKAPKLVTNSTVAHMKPGAVLVDIAIDQGGCFEDSRPTTHDDPDLRGARHACSTAWPTCPAPCRARRPTR